MMERWQHYLKPTAGNCMPESVVCFDAKLAIAGHSEDGSVMREECIGVEWLAYRRHGNEYKLCVQPEIASSGIFFADMPRIMRRKQHTWIFAFNLLRQLRAMRFFDLLESGEWIMTSLDNLRLDGTIPKDKRRLWHGFAVLEDPPTIIECRPSAGVGTARLVDLRNYGVKDLSLLGEGTPLESIASFVMRIIQWLDGEQLGSLQNTAGSQAMYTFRRKYMQHQIECHCNEDALALEQAAYYGGRCECRFVGKTDQYASYFGTSADGKIEEYHSEPMGKIYHLDFNSLYPAVCSVNSLPVKLVRYIPASEDIPVLHVPAGHGVIAKVLLETEEPLYPLRKADGIYYPVGRFWTTLAGPELFLAGNKGHVKVFAETALYKLEPILTEYMRDMYQWRTAFKTVQDTALSQMLKAMLVALPGKFGQQSFTWRDDNSKVPHEPWGLFYEYGGTDAPLKKWRTIAWHCQREVCNGIHHNAVPAIAAWITSLARFKLLEAMEIAGKGNVLYYDTDSLWTNESGYNNLSRQGWIHSDDLGKLKIVSPHESVEFLGIKHYIADGKETCAGRPSTASFRADGKWHWDQNRHVMYDIAHKRSPQPEVIDRVWKARSTYKYGSVQSDGWVLPLREK